MIVNDRFTALLAGMVLGAAWCYVFLAWWTGQTEQEPDVDLDEWLDLDDGNGAYALAAERERQMFPMVTVSAGPTTKGTFSLSFGGAASAILADPDEGDDLRRARDRVAQELAHLAPVHDLQVSGGGAGEPLVVTFLQPDPLSYHRGTYAWGYRWAEFLPPDAKDPVVRYYPFSDRELRGVRERLAERGLALKVVTPGEGPWDRATYTITTRTKYVPPPGPGIPWDQPGADPLADVLGYGPEDRDRWGRTKAERDAEGARIAAMQDYSGDWC